MMNMRISRTILALCVLSVSVIGATVLPGIAMAADIKEAIPAGSGIKAEEFPIGTVFLNADGMRLYTYDNDKASGKSSCTDKCEKVWPPLVAAADAKPSGSWTLTTRDDGTKQWVYDGSPLYTYVKDRLPGLALGDNVQDIWHAAIKLAPRPREVSYRGTALGRVAADVRGKTLYQRADDNSLGQACTGACLRQWIPLRAASAAVALGDWSVTERGDDGSPQWAYKSKPVYRYAEDAKLGDVTGEGVDKAWRAVVVEAAAPPPSWITIQPSEFGPIFADARGMTLYAFPMDIETYEKISCHEACFREHFIPVAAKGDEAETNAPGSNWGVVVNPDGQKQWSYKGQLVYTFVNDKVPSDVKGVSFGMPGLGQHVDPIQVASGFLPVL
jgi:predicted lipoprotein with Yx(FWY)xxD motif